MKNKILITLLLLITSFGYTQITRTAGRVQADGTTEIYSKQVESTATVTYVANDSLVRELFAYKLVSVFIVEGITFYADKIFYRVRDGEGHLFGITYTFADGSVFISNEEGNFVEFRGEGLTFSHQY